MCICLWDELSVNGWQTAGQPVGVYVNDHPPHSFIYSKVVAVHIFLCWRPHSHPRMGLMHTVKHYTQYTAYNNLTIALLNQTGITDRGRFEMSVKNTIVCLFRNKICSVLQSCVFLLCVCYEFRWVKNNKHLLCDDKLRHFTVIKMHAAYWHNFHFLEAIHYLMCPRYRAYL